MGGGLFYDTGVALSAQGYYGIGTTGFASYTTAFPATQTQVNAAPTPSAAAPYNAPIYGYDPNLKLPYTGEWNLAVEQALGEKQSLNVNYVASAGRRLLAQRFYMPQTLGNTAFADGKGLYLTTGAASSDYDALQVKSIASYRVGCRCWRAIRGRMRWIRIRRILQPMRWERANSDYDIRHNFQMAASYDVGGRYRNAAEAYVLQHWALDTRISARSALPIDVLQPQTVDPASGATIQLHPDRVLSQPLYLTGSGYRGGRAINYNAFSPYAGTTGDGSAGRNVARGFDAVQTDLTMRRDFPIHEQVGLQFRAEAYNVFNHAIYGSVYNNLSSGATLFGQTYNTLNNELGGLNGLYQVGGPRSLQVALKLHF